MIRNQRLTLAVLCASMFMIGIDQTVLHVAVPTISRRLLPSAAELLWIVDGYPLTVAAGLITFGTLGDRYGRRRMLLAGFAVFGAASAFAGLAATPVQLIVARVLLGVGGAMIMSSTPAVIRVAFPDAGQRSGAVGLWVAGYSVGVSAGPLLGGALIERFWWGSVFLVNVPIVVAALVAGALLVAESRHPRPHRWDWLGALLCALGLAAVVYAVQRLGEGPGVHPVTWALGAVGVALVVGFVVRQRRIDNPLVDLALFADRGFRTAALCVLGCYGAYAGLMFLLTQRFQLVDGYSPLVAGVSLVPLAAANAVGAAIAARLAARVGQRWGLSGGLALLAAALVAFGVFGTDGNYAALVAAGFGSGVVMTLGTAAMLGAARPERAGEVGAVQETSFSLGAGLGLALVGTTLSLVYRASWGPVPGATDRQLQTARDTLGSAAEVAAQAGGPTGDALLAAARQAFDTGFTVATAVAAAVLVPLAALAAARGTARAEPAPTGVRASGASPSR